MKLFSRGPLRGYCHDNCTVLFYFFIGDYCLTLKSPPIISATVLIFGVFHRRGDKLAMGQALRQHGKNMRMPKKCKDIKDSPST